jgi:hypothetical protein
VETAWLSGLALNFSSEAMKYNVMQNYTQLWSNHNLDEYTTGMLTSGYHVAWRTLVKHRGNSSEPAMINSAKPVVRASINRTKLYVWLTMNAMLALSAILVFVARCIRDTKTIRDCTRTSDHGAHRGDTRQPFEWIM